MRPSLKLAAVALLVTGFYSYFGNTIPQARWEPPKKKEISKGMSPLELASAGREIFLGRGCAVCHSINPGEERRGPNLAGVGGRKDLKYLAESLYNPSAIVVEGFPDIMPPANRPPLNLTDEEITAVVAFLQSLGGKPTVKIGDITPPVAVARREAPQMGIDKPEALMEKYACFACHKVGEKGTQVGPPLTGVGRKGQDYIRESILYPGRVVTQGYQNIMPPDLGQKMTALEFETIVRYLEGLK